MLAGVLRQNSLLTIDNWVSEHMYFVQLVWLDPIVKIITDINGLLGAALFSVGGATALFILVKQLVVRSRPESAIIEIGGYSFPSGHTTMATAMAFALYFILLQTTQLRQYRRVLFSLALGVQ